MAMFSSYVELPEGIGNSHPNWLSLFFLQRGRKYQQPARKFGFGLNCEFETKSELGRSKLELNQWPFQDYRTSIKAPPKRWEIDAVLPHWTMQNLEESPFQGEIAPPPQHRLARLLVALNVAAVNKEEGGKVRMKCVSQEGLASGVTNRGIQKRMFFRKMEIHKVYAFLTLVNAARPLMPCETGESTFKPCETILNHGNPKLSSTILNFIELDVQKTMLDLNYRQSWTIQKPTVKPTLKLPHSTSEVVVRRCQGLPVAQGMLLWTRTRRGSHRAVREGLPGWHHRGRLWRIYPLIHVYMAIENAYSIDISVYQRVSHVGNFGFWLLLMVDSKNMPGCYRYKANAPPFWLV